MLIEVNYIEPGNWQAAGMPHTLHAFLTVAVHDSKFLKIKKHTAGEGYF
jgi:hypothetical protein